MTNIKVWHNIGYMSSCKASSRTQIFAVLGLPWMRLDRINVVKAAEQVEFTYFVLPRPKRATVLYAFTLNDFYHGGHWLRRCYYTFYLPRNFNVGHITYGPSAGESVAITAEAYVETSPGWMAKMIVLSPFLLSSAAMCLVTIISWIWRGRKILRYYP